MHNEYDDILTKVDWFRMQTTISIWASVPFLINHSNSKYNCNTVSIDIKIIGLQKMFFLSLNFTRFRLNSAFAHWTDPSWKNWLSFAYYRKQNTQQYKLWGLFYYPAKKIPILLIKIGAKKMALNLYVIGLGYMINYNSTIVYT